MAAGAVSLPVVLLLMLVVELAAAVSYNESSGESLAQMQWGSARATWYGQPNGAGPYDNGMHALHYCNAFSICYIRIILRSSISDIY